MPPLSLNLAYPDIKVFNAYISMTSELGIKRLSISAETLKKICEDKDFAAAAVKSAECHKISFIDAHAPHSFADSLGNPTAGGAEHSTEVMLQSLRGAADIGVKIVTMHTARTRLVGNFAPAEGPIENIDLDGALERVLRQLDILIPEAEKLGIIIAIENLFLPSGTASHLMRIINKARHANLGLCYDSGHALLLERTPDKTPDMIADWISCGWENDTVIFQDDQLDIMLNEVVTTHLHDNDGREDQHLLPFDGIANWAKIAARLKNAPRLLSVQSEVSTDPLMADWKKSLQKFAEAGFPIE